MKMEKQDIAALVICFVVLVIIMPMIVGGAP